MTKLSSLFLFLFFLITTSANSQAPSLELEAMATFTKPVEIAHAGDDRLFICEQHTGLIRIMMPNGTILSQPFLNMGTSISKGSEQGLLGLAFHPDYQTNGYFYIHYTTNSNSNYICRFKVSSSDPDVANKSSETLIISQSQPRSNHNGGSLEFGPDGYLYFGIGDGGKQGDPDNNAQDSTTLLGKIGRIDIDGGFPFAIPDGNPFKGISGTRQEIYHWGLRNPWKFSFDQETDDIWIGDVGQDAYEEFNYAKASEGPINFGWHCREGMHDYTPGTCSDGRTIVEPVFEFGQNDGACSSIGGYVYRGSEWNRMNGYYVMADLCLGEIWTLNNTGSSWNSTHHNDVSFGSWVAFGEDAHGELYAASSSNGTVYKIIDGGCKDYSPKLMATLGENPSLGIDVASSATWYKVGTMASIATTLTYDPNSAGDYYAIAENTDGCQRVSDTISVTITGVNSGIDHQYSLYPNPSTDQFHFTSLEKTNIVVRNSNSVVIKTYNGVKELNFGKDLDQGVYLIELSNDNGLSSRKVVKE